MADHALGPGVWAVGRAMHVLLISATAAPTQGRDTYGTSPGGALLNRRPPYMHSSALHDLGNLALGKL